MCVSLSFELFVAAVQLFGETSSELLRVSTTLACGVPAAPFLPSDRIESFVLSELWTQAAVIDEPIMFFHFRDRSGVEVDVIIERVDGSVIAVEIKSATTANQADARGLRFLRDRLGDRFVTGVVFYTGPLTGRLDDRIWFTPISGAVLALRRNTPPIRQASSAEFRVRRRGRKGMYLGLRALTYRTHVLREDHDDRLPCSSR